MTYPFRLEPGQSVNLADLPTDGKQFYDGDKETAVVAFKTIRKELRDWQRKLYAEGKQKLLVVFQAMDAGGKDGTIRNVFKGVNPQGVIVTSFKVPSKKELAHDFLWRVHRAVPGKGMIGVFNRSHYEDVLVVRVDNIVPEAVWRPRYAHINHFEQLLHDSGTHILKFYLHISKEEQRERFQSRLDEPDKNWKFSFGDLEKRKQWPDYMAAYEEMLHNCTTPHAPWHVIPANQKWYRNLVITRIIVEKLREMNPHYPPPEDDLSNVIIPD